ncbi:PREDICTED: putative RING-H2 finger protein ATL53 [Tarenaya hassleriana]|uniref:putative RING-H2 finger protein ATL53 n=1 Tax=Tarenaya hassleriana TaxID=28532 RepID=UPI00053C8EFD|nr:PREDICTED: putative RING-H2 finger protein ATL53 [Tarenaya hassleriana]
MATGSNSDTWAQNINSQDCSQGFCSIYCPQWCYIIFSPPPPPYDLPNDDVSSNPNLSPLVISIIGILASAFLLVSYYTLISKYCGNATEFSGIERSDRNLDESAENSVENRNPFAHEPPNAGLDDALIKLIRHFKYKKQDRLVINTTDCSICLGEFNEEESLRILPKCSHVFHVACVDRWLKSHSNCPLCRANITVPTQELDRFAMNLDRGSVEGREVIVEETSRMNTNTFHRLVSLPKPTSVRAFVDPDKGDTVIEIRRSASVDFISYFPRQLSVADVLRMNEEDEECSDLGNPTSIKRSFSSGGMFLGAQGRIRPPRHPPV